MRAKIAKDECEESFKRLESAGFGSVEARTRNNKTYSICKKKYLLEIASSLDVLDKWTRTVSFKECEENHIFAQSTSEENVDD